MEQSKYLSHDTIHALATPVGGALAIVRMSGPFAVSILGELVGGLSERGPREIFRTKLFGWGKGPQAEAPEVLDDATAVFYGAPKSQTGEDLVEFFLHGGTVVVERVLLALEKAGSRQALAGEFSFRAVRNGKMSIAEARAVADLIAATNEGAARLALEKMEGSQSRLVMELAERLRKLATMGELGIDFADQEVEELSLPTLKLSVRDILDRLCELESSFDRGEKIQSGVRVAFVGRPNAGKSSFFNALLGEERSIVSEIAGTTRDVVRERLTLRSAGATVTFRLEDTAGIRAETEDEIEREGIARTERAAKDADLVVLIADADADKAGWEETGAIYSAFVGAQPERRERTLAVLTKRDCVDAEGLRRAEKELAKIGVRIVGTTSVKTAEGISEVARGIAEFGGRLTRRKPGEVLLTRLDELRSVRETVTHLERALTVTEEDLFAADLRQALVALGPVIGETLPDDILGRIFSEFCIGK